MSMENLSGGTGGVYGADSISEEDETEVLNQSKFKHVEIDKPINTRT